MTTVRTPLAVASIHHWSLHHIRWTFKMHFFMVILRRQFICPGYQLAEKTLVCRLRKSLYGLKQVHGLINFEPQFWVSTRVRTTIPCFFAGVQLAVLLLYVDDMIITGDDTKGITQLKHFLQSSFRMKDLGALTSFLGLEVSSSAHCINLYQKKYTEDLICLAKIPPDT